MLEELECRWYDRYEAKVKELAADYHHRVDALVEKSRQDWVANMAELEAKSREISTLQVALEGQINETLRFKETVNLRGGLEWIVYQAKGLGKIKKDCAPGIQAGLNEIANTAAFGKVLAKELVSRNLLEKDVKRCIAVLYHEASKQAHGNKGKITIYHEDHVENERAALVTFFKVQSGWADCLKWEEVPRSPQKV
ncbi:hypothetical protein L873DRAFT_1849151 [Choiromyces venosus 120613-1]|uniref:Uncharacterized protein n=1 Tax=Choiromyces venosus 120613-1 TaxID=1336337 RepID=A0A3N4IYD4_9PEZI|nr:hypothetical protein L873DRAFT_1849151 [Choiromyces venosus 120613-1]